MAQKTVVTLIDDIDESEADETVGFGLDGVTYEIDLNDQNATNLRDALADYIAHARRTGGRKAPGRPAGSQLPVRVTTGRPVPPSSPRAQSTTADREQNKAVRDWCARQGVQIAERGRIPSYATTAYHANDADMLRAKAPGGAVTSGESTVEPDRQAELTIATTPEESSDPADVEPAQTAPTGWPYVEPPKTRNLSRSEREVVRSWAQNEEIAVSERGGVKQDVVDRYHAWRTSSSPKLASVG